MKEGLRLLWPGSGSTLMKTRAAVPWFLAFICGFVLATARTFGGPFIPVSATDPQASPASGGGDSWAPVVSPDGRYLLFASTANNLCSPTSNGAPASALFPARLNVFLRDRTNGTT